MKVALVHDYLNQYGGAERVLEALHEIWPEAPVFTSIYDKEKMDSFGFDPSGWDIHPSFMQGLPLKNFLPKYYYTFLYPAAFASFDFGGYDLIFSDVSYAAKNIRRPKGAVHISYIHTPPRFLYGYDQETTVSSMKPLEKLASRAFVPFLRRLDQRSLNNIDYFLANSTVVKERIKEVYKHDAKTIFPPVDTDRFEKKVEGPKESIKEPYFLVISRLGDYKRVDIVVEAFARFDHKLKVIGVGPKLDYLRALATPNVEFLGRVDDELAAFYLKNALALIFPTEDDFGITPLEALACGRPVIAFKAGGALDSLNDKCAKFFYPQTSEALLEALKNFDPAVYNPITLKKQASKFSKDRFKKEILEFVEAKIGNK